MEKIIVGCDDVAVLLKNNVINYIQALGYECVDYGVNEMEHTIYPDIALEVAKDVANGKYKRGILICGTGIGMAITANKVPGVRAAVCHDIYSAERARRSNDAQIITIGSRVIGIELAKKILDVWLSCEFEGGRSIIKVNRINEIDKKYRKFV